MATSTARGMAGDLRHGGQLGTVNTRPVSIDVDLAGRVHVAWWPSTATCPRSCIAYRRRDPGGSEPTISYPIPSPRRCSCRSWSPRTSAAAAGSWPGGRPARRPARQRTTLLADRLARHRPSPHRDPRPPRLHPPRRALRPPAAGQRPRRRRADPQRPLLLRRRPAPARRPQGALPRHLPPRLPTTQPPRRRRPRRLPHQRPHPHDNRRPHDRHVPRMSALRRVRTARRSARSRRCRR